MAERVMLRRALPRDLLGVRAVSETHRQIVAEVLERETVGKLLARVAELEADVAALKRLVPHGTSAFEWEDGQYEGEWQGHLLDEDCPEEVWYVKRPHGHGEWTGEGDELYTGDWRDGAYNGAGRLIKWGSMYVGDFMNGVPHGQGRWTSVDGTWREGRLVEGRFEGTVREHQPGRTVDVEVEFRQGVRVATPGAARRK